jgi:hypothetical protein
VRGDIDRAPEIGLAGVLLVPGQPDRLIDGLAVKLSHDQPFDVAVCEEVPEAILAASERFLPYTSVRAWAADLGERLGADDATAEVGQRLQQVVRDVPFDHEISGSAYLSNLIAGLPAGALDGFTRYEARWSPPPPPERSPSGAPSTEQQLAERLEAQRLEAAQEAERLQTQRMDADRIEAERTQRMDADRIEAERLAATQLADRRRLQTDLTDGSGRKRSDAFVAGQRHELRVRIAAGVTEGAVTANAVFISPTPGKKARLTVTARVRGTADPSVRRTLDLPATEDSRWTASTPLIIPRRQQRATVEMVVLHRGRTVQTATLSGPVNGRASRSSSPAWS